MVARTTGSTRTHTVPRDRLAAPPHALFLLQGNEVITKRKEGPKDQERLRELEGPPTRQPARQPDQEKTRKKQGEGGGTQKGPYEHEYEPPPHGHEGQPQRKTSAPPKKAAANTDEQDHQQRRHGLDKDNSEPHAGQQPGKQRQRDPGQPWTPPTPKEEP